MLRKFAIVVVLIFSALLVVLPSLISTTVTADSGVVYYLPAGKSKPAAIADLAQSGLINHPLIFSLYVALFHNTELKTGEYLFPKGSTPISIWRQLTAGKGFYYRAFTIIPGWSFSQLRRELLQTETLRHNSNAMDDRQIMQMMGQPNLGPEGQFFPETYHYTRGVTDLVILKRSFELMRLRTTEAWEARLPGLPYRSLYEALIAASLIEKEAYLASERPVIAGVLINRLRKNMRLQFDPTVIYGLGDSYTGKIHKKDLVRDTAYNTYLHKGLPPTPIAMPSMASIEAALHPQVNDYLYFVARGDGSHQFSRTLAEHNEAVMKLQKKKTAYFNESLVEKQLPQLHLHHRIL